MLALLVPGVALVAAIAVQLTRGPTQADRVAVAAAVIVAVPALLLAAIALGRGGSAPLRGTLHLVDAASGVYLAVIAVVGLCSALVSPAYLRTSGRGWFSAERSRHWYYGALFAFWGALLAVPIAANLAIAWLLVEATTAASALLIAFTGKRDALEAGWKYLVLTTLGLSVSLLGIVILALTLSAAGHGGLAALDWHALESSTRALEHDTTLLAFVLLMAGLATKIGWAPVHNWLPDAHSEAPAPISALLSAALLPTVLLVAWRLKVTLDAAVGGGTSGAVFLAFGLASLVVAVPFLWRALPWKRLLAYSSLEHMGVIALGIGFGTPLAIAGAIVHVAGHALAKALGFYAALPLLRNDPEAARRAPTGVLRRSPRTATAMGVSLVALSGLPPSPLFVSELLILLGGVQAGETAIAATAAVALALGFLGLLHALLEGVIGEPERPSRRGRPSPSRSERTVAWLTLTLGAAMLAIGVAGVLLLDSALVQTLARGSL
jgi:hydrogenase-4 component F